METKLLRPHHTLIAATFALMIAGLLFVANMGMDVLTSMRAYVGGEGLWSKGQKDSVLYLLRYGKPTARRIINGICNRSRFLSPITMLA
jgi:hypothetical protein